MRYYLLSKADLLGNLILNRLLAILCPGHEVRVYLSDSILPEERGHPHADLFINRVRDYPVETLFPAIDAQPWRTRPRLKTFNALAEAFGVPVTPLGDDPARAFGIVDDDMGSKPADVIICCRHDFVVPRSIYSRAPRGAYNFHSAVLPKYRGPFCAFWTMYNRDEAGGCTIHTLKDKVDTGDIVAMGRTAIDYRASLLANMVNIYAAGVSALADLLPRLEEGALPGVPQPEGSGRYYRQPNADEWRRFVEGGRIPVDDDHYGKLLSRYLDGSDASASLLDGRRW